MDVLDNKFISFNDASRFTVRANIILGICIRDSSRIKILFQANTINPEYSYDVIDYANTDDRNNDFNRVQNLLVYSGEKG